MREILHLELERADLRAARASGGVRGDGAKRGGAGRRWLTSASVVGSPNLHLFPLKGFTKAVLDDPAPGLMTDAGSPVRVSNAASSFCPRSVALFRNTCGARRGAEA